MNTTNEPMDGLTEEQAQEFISDIRVANASSAAAKPKANAAPGETVLDIPALNFAQDEAAPLPLTDDEPPPLPVLNFTKPPAKAQPALTTPVAGGEEALAMPSVV